MGEYWKGQGGIYYGVAINDAGEDHYIIVYDGLFADTGTHKAVTKWASKLSADGHKDFTLPTKRAGHD